jgi:hypothetical protein
MVSPNATFQRRKEPRIGVNIPVRIWGIDAAGNRFEEDVTAINFSGSGALLLDVEPMTRSGDLMGVAYKGAKARFRIVWMRTFGLHHKSRVAVQRLEKDRCPWQELLPSQTPTLETARTLGNTEGEEKCGTHSESHKNDTIGFGKACTQIRRWRRHKVDVPIRVIVHGTSKTSLFDGRGNELSEGGMALTAGLELRLGDRVEIEFTPPYSGSPIRHRGIVRNRTGYRYGIEFVTDNNKEMEQMERLLRVLTSM